MYYIGCKSYIITLIFIFTGITGLRGQSLPFACAGNTEMYGVSGFEGSVFEWIVDGGDIVADYNDTVVIQWDYTKRNHRIQVVEITMFDCIGTPVEGSVEIRGPEVDLGADQYEICADGTFEFDAVGNYTEPVLYLWHDGSAGDSYSTGREERVWVKVTDGDGCVDHDTSSLLVHPLPVVDLGPDTSLCGTSTIELDAGFYSFYDWSTGDIGTPVTVGSNARGYDTISVSVTDEHGCTSGDTIIILPCNSDLLFANMPNAITPNGDGSNDVWEIPYINYFPNAELEIFDRWGRMIYRTENIEGEPWDGNSMSGKKMPMDSYYYVIRLNEDNTEPLVGTINVIR